MTNVMKRFFTIIIAIASLATAAIGAESGWMTDFEASRQKAEKENKPILMNFTGSDFCPPCIMLTKEVFDTPEFKKYATENLILMEVDFPQSKPQSPSLKRQNASLAQALEIHGYPSLYLVTHDLKVLTPRLGYYPGGPEVWIEGLEKFIKAAE